MGVETSLIPGRFILMMGHFLAVSMAFMSMDDNIRAGVDSNVTEGDDDWTSAESSITAALSLTCITFSVQFVGLFGGFTMFSNEVNLMHIVLHFFGAIFVSIYVTEEWGYSEYWYMFLFLSLPSLIVESCCILRVALFQRQLY
eukprot:Rmarinus@m.5603